MDPSDAPPLFIPPVAAHLVERIDPVPTTPPTALLRGVLGPVSDDTGTTIDWRVLPDQIASRLDDIDVRDVARELSAFRASYCRDTRCGTIATFGSCLAAARAAADADPEMRALISRVDWLNPRVLVSPAAVIPLDVAKHQAVAAALDAFEAATIRTGFAPAWVLADPSTARASVLNSGWTGTSETVASGARVELRSGPQGLHLFDGHTDTPISGWSFDGDLVRWFGVDGNDGEAQGSDATMFRNLSEGLADVEIRVIPAHTAWLEVFQGLRGPPGVGRHHLIGR